MLLLRHISYVGGAHGVASCSLYQVDLLLHEYYYPSDLVHCSESNKSYTYLMLPYLLPYYHI